MTGLNLTSQEWEAALRVVRARWNRSAKTKRDWVQYVRDVETIRLTVKMEQPK